MGQPRPRLADPGHQLQDKLNIMLQFPTVATSQLQARHYCALQL